MHHELELPVKWHSPNQLTDEEKAERAKVHEKRQAEREADASRHWAMQETEWTLAHLLNFADLSDAPLEAAISNLRTRCKITENSYERIADAAERIAAAVREPFAASKRRQPR